MSTGSLHIVCASPAEGDAFVQCLRAVRPGDTLLLIGNGVCAAAAGTAHAALLETLPGSVKMYALDEDCQARGLGDRMAARVSGADYGTFVELACATARSVTWA